MAEILGIGEGARRPRSRRADPVIRRRRKLALGLAVLAAINLAGLARAEILSADLQVHGMSCPFCAFGIEKKLLAVDGVTKVEVLLDEGRLHLELEPGNTATIVALERAVGKAGFELAELLLELRGTLEIEATETWLEAHAGLRFLLLERTADGQRSLSAATRKRLPVDDRGRVLASRHLLRGEGAHRLLLELPRPARTPSP